VNVGQQVDDRQLRARVPAEPDKRPQQKGDPQNAVQSAPPADHVLQEQDDGQRGETRAENGDAYPVRRPDRLPGQTLLRGFCFAARGRAGICGLGQAIAGRRCGGSDDVSFGKVIRKIEACKAWRTDSVAANKHAQLPWLQRIEIALVLEKDQRAFRKVGRILGVEERQGLDLLWR
jgi:hypothetical protein